MSQLVDLMQLLDVAHLLDYWPTWGVLVFAFPWAFCKSVGGARGAERTALGGLEDRVSALGGRLVIESPPGRAREYVRSCPYATSLNSEQVRALNRVVPSLWRMGGAPRPDCDSPAFASERQRQSSSPCRFRAIASSRSLLIRSRSLACERPTRME
jgi:hypothetical protein